MTIQLRNLTHLSARRGQNSARACQALLESQESRAQQNDMGQPNGLASSPDARTDAALTPRPDVPAAVRFGLAEHDQVYPLNVGVNTIGRLAENDVVLTGAGVSRRHGALLIQASEACELHDTASRNGTFVNGLRISSPTPVGPGDVIQIGDHRLVLKKLE